MKTELLYSEMAVCLLDGTPGKGLPLDEKVRQKEEGSGKGRKKQLSSDLYFSPLIDTDCVLVCIFTNSTRNNKRLSMLCFLLSSVTIIKNCKEMSVMQFYPSEVKIQHFVIYLSIFLSVCTYIHVSPPIVIVQYTLFYTT